MKRVLAWVACICFTACGGCDDDKGQNNGSNNDVQVATFLGATCDALERCPNFAWYPIAYRNRTECTQILNWAVTCELTETELGNNRSEWGVKKRDVNVDEEQVDACVEWLKTADCDDLILDTEIDTPCSDVFNFQDSDDDPPPGALGIDDPCNRDEQCSEDLYCKGGGVDPDRNVSVCQVCRPRESEGDECWAGTERVCEDELYCRSDADGMPTCVPRLADDADCTIDWACESGFCNGNLGMDLGGWGACDPGGKIGDPCTDEDPDAPYNTGCRYNFHCDDGTCAERNPIGDACAGNWECDVLGICTDGLCGYGTGDACQEHEYCISEICQDGLCVERTGDMCTADDQCDSGESCEGICRAPDCFCSGGGCPIGSCQSGDGNNGNNTNPQTCEDDFDCPTGRCEGGMCSDTTLGTSCSASYECYPQGYCSGGTCVEKHDPGESCTDLDSCKEPFLCQDGSCEIINLACEPGKIGQGCAMLRVCDASSYCDIMGGFKCIARSGVGESCTASFIPGIETCAVGSTCIEGTCEVQPTEGEVCTTIQCATGSYCFGGTCEGYPIGQPCDYDTPCPDGLFCDDDQEICLPPKPQGRDCREQFECEAGLYCQNYDSCEERGLGGTACNEDFECREDLYCRDETRICTPDAAMGQPCDRSDQGCAAGLRCSDDVDPTCVMAFADGESCSSSADCQSGYCHDFSVCLASGVCEPPQ